MPADHSPARARLDFRVVVPGPQRPHLREPPLLGALRHLRRVGSQEAPVLLAVVLVLGPGVAFPQRPAGGAQESLALRLQGTLQHNLIRVRRRGAKCTEAVSSSRQGNLGEFDEHQFFRSLCARADGGGRTACAARLLCAAHGARCVKRAEGLQDSLGANQSIPISSDASSAAALVGMIPCGRTLR